MPDLPLYRQRVIQERDDLDIKLKKLDAFITSPLFPALDADEKRRLREQQGHMADYLNVLDERIAAFGN